MTTQRNLSKLKAIFDKISKDHKDWQDLIHFSMSEEWFSNMFAALLDSREKSYFGSSFPKKFITKIAANRAEEANGLKSKKNKLVLRKHRTNSSRKSVSDLARGITNAGVIREFPLGAVNSKDKYGQCDIVLLDLDKKDSFTLVVENKLFTHNHKDQLYYYRKYFNEVFYREKYQEYVYLTLLGVPPKAHDSGKDGIEAKYWVQLSWTKDILEILHSLNLKNPTKNKRVKNLINVLEFLNALNNIRLDKNGSNNDIIHEAKLDILWSFGECFTESLNRLKSDDVPGQWTLHPKSRESLRSKTLIITPPRHHAKKLKLKLDSDLSFIIEDEYHGKRSFKRILVPSKIPRDQIINFLEVMALNVYRGILSDPKSYLGNKRRLASPKTMENLYETLELIHKYTDFLRLIDKIDSVSVEKVIKSNSIAA